jgi:hypothetical protein
MTLRRVARPRLLDSHCLLENSRGCFREIALFPILLLFRFALRFGHVESCHRSTLREILKFKLTHYENTVRESGSHHSRQNNSGHNATDATEAQPQRQVMQCDTQCSSDACADRDR